MSPRGAHDRSPRPVHNPPMPSFKSSVAALSVAFTAALAANLCCVLPAHAADKFPTKAVRIIVPSPPGGSNDFMARQLSQKLQERWNQPVIVEYKPGAGQTIGTDFVAKAAADGHTIGLIVTSHVINPSLRGKLPYDTLADFAGVTLIGFSPTLISTASTAPYRNLADVLAKARSSPGEITYATPGVGSSMHFGGDFLGRTAGVELRHIPFRGGAQQLQEVLAGRVALNIGTLGTALPFIKAGQVTPIALTDPKRSSTAPDIPTVAESIPGFGVQSFIGFVVPAGTPRDIVQTIRNDVVAALRAQDVAAALGANGIEITGSTPEEFDRFIAEQVARWATVVKKTGITTD